MPVNFKFLYQAALFITVICHLLRSQNFWVLWSCKNLGYLNPLINHFELFIFFQLHYA